MPKFDIEATFSLSVSCEIEAETKAEAILKLKSIVTENSISVFSEEYIEIDCVEYEQLNYIKEKHPK